MEKNSAKPAKWQPFETIFDNSSYIGLKQTNSSFYAGWRATYQSKARKTSGYIIPKESHSLLYQHTTIFWSK